MSADLDAMTAVELRGRIARREISPVEATRRALDKAQATQGSLNAFFLLTSWALLRSRAVAQGVAVLGLAAGVAGLVGMFRNVTAAVAPVAAVNNYLLPAWMIVFGVVLVRWREPVPSL